MYGRERDVEEKKSRRITKQTRKPKRNASRDKSKMEAEQSRHEAYFFILLNVINPARAIEYPIFIVYPVSHHFPPTNNLESTTYQEPASP